MLKRRIANAVVFCLCFGATVEVASRLNQWVAYGAPLLGTYSYDSALFATDEFGIRGKPYGRYEKWKLNAYGFRGEDVAVQKLEGRVRVICLGASETFGLYETAGNEWPRRFEQALRRAGANAEVINASVAGMTLPQRARHFESRLLTFKPDVLVFMLEYGSYAGLTQDNLPIRRQIRTVLPEQSGWIDRLKSLRSIGGMRDIVVPKLPPVVRESLGQVETAIRTKMMMRSLGREYRSYRQVTPFEKDTFLGDLERVAGVARKAGIRLVLIAPAMWFSEANLNSMYLSWPYVDERWWREASKVFPAIADEFARSHELEYLDLSESVRGRESEYMRDFLHFSDQGADFVGARLAGKLGNVKTPPPSLQGSRDQADPLKAVSYERGADESK